MSAEKAPSLAGSTVGRYQLVDKLGHGAMATVYRAVDPTLGREVAVKVMHPFIAERSDMSTRFEREAKSVAGLRHPNVLQLHDYAPATAEHPAYLVMELLTGPSLQRFLVEHGAPLAEVAAMIGLRLAQALSAAHARGIVHRDVKPENVMFDLQAGIPLGTASGEAPRLAPLGSPVRVVLCDFGIARVAAAEGMTATGAIMGSPAYMSPEQASGHEIDARSDQFSLGALMYQLATGAVPFSGGSPLATMAKIVAGEHRPPSAKNPRVPNYLERVIERCLMSKPASRFPSVDAIAEALRDGLTNDGLGDVDAELAKYVRDPAAYNAAAGPRIISTALEQAERAVKAGQRARALGAASRVLAWDPKHPRALALADAASPVRVRRVLLALLPVLLIAGAGAWWLRFERRNVDASRPLTKAPQVAAPTPAPPPPSPAPVKVEAESKAPPPPANEKRHHVKPATNEPSTSGVAPAAAGTVRSTTPATGGAPSATTPATNAGAAATAPAADAKATLTVAIAPWCDLTVDATPRGRTPQTLALAPGAHHVACKNPVSGQSLSRDVVLAPGESRTLRERLYATVRVTPQLQRGDAVTVDDDAPSAASRELAPGRHRVTLTAAGAPLDTRWIDVPPGGCRLVDKPELACEKP
jgi:eukaryotic-like serine/threonine-protein kinase